MYCPKKEQRSWDPVKIYFVPCFLNAFRRTLEFAKYLDGSDMLLLGGPSNFSADFLGFLAADQRFLFRGLHFPDDNRRRNDTLATRIFS